MPVGERRRGGSKTAARALVQASGSLDGSARVWRPAEGAGAAAATVLEGHGGPVTALAAGADAVRPHKRAVMHLACIAALAHPLARLRETAQWTPDQETSEANCAPCAPYYTVPAPPCPPPTRPPRR